MQLCLPLYAHCTEIRAFYFGTLVVLGSIFLRGAKPSSNAEEMREALCVIFWVLSLFVVGRAVSYIVDGPPSLTYSYVMWGIEAAGAVIAGILFSKEWRVGSKSS